MSDFRFGDKVKIIEHNDAKFIGKTGVLIAAQTPRSAIDGQAITWKVCKVKLDENGEVIDCLLSQLSKSK